MSRCVRQECLTHHSFFIFAFKEKPAQPTTETASLAVAQPTDDADRK